MRADRIFILNVPESHQLTIQEYFGLISLKSFSIQYKVIAYLTKFYQIAGSINAMVVQESVISSKLVTTSISEQFDLILLPSDKLLDEYLNNNPENDADKFSDDSYDIAKIALEYLSLSLPSYPKLPGEHSRSGDNYNKSTDETEIIRISPFAKLKNHL